MVDIIEPNAPPKQTLPNTGCCYGGLFAGFWWEWADLMLMKRVFVFHYDSLKGSANNEKRMGPKGEP